MGFEIEKLDLEGMLLIHAHVANDNRGFYRKNFERNIFAENGLDFSVTEWSDIYSHKGAIRGLHFQTGESQAKLLHVIRAPFMMWLLISGGIQVRLASGMARHCVRMIIKDCTYRKDLHMAFWH